MKTRPILLRAGAAFAVAALLAGCAHEGEVRKPLIPDYHLVLSNSLRVPVDAALAAAAIAVVINPLGPNWKPEDRELAPHRYRIILKRKRFSAGGDGEAYAQFLRQAERIAEAEGARAYSVLQFSEGIDSSLPVAQRIAEGIIETVPAQRAR